MATNKPIPLIQDSALKWAMQYPEAANELITIVNRLYALDYKLITPSTNNRQDVLFQNPQSFTLALPLKFSESIANSTANVTSVSTQLNTLLQQLRLTGQNPS